MILDVPPRQCPALRIRRFSVRASDPPPAAPFLAPPAHPLCESRCKRPKTALDVRTLRFTAIRKQPAQCTSKIRKAPTLPIVRPESRLPQRDSNGSRAAAEARRTPPHRTRFERSMTDFRRAEDSGFPDGLQAISETPSKPLSTVVAFSVRASPFGQGLMPESRSNGIAYRPQFPESGEPCRSLLTNRRSFHPRPLPAFVAFRFYPRIGAAVHKAPGTAFAATKT